MTDRVSLPSLFDRDTPRFRESSTGRVAKYPRRWWQRWTVRLVIAAVYAVLALLAASEATTTATANAELAARVAELRAGGPSAATIVGELYPPISSLIALLIPGGALGLSLAGCLVAGIMLQLLVQSMQRKHFLPVIRVVFVLTVATTPVFAYIATTNFEAILGLAFFGLGMVDLVRFVTWANTQAGFRAGLLFAAAAFSDSTMTFSALVAAIAGALIIQSRQRARVANAFVLAFPTVAVFCSLAVLGVAFGAGPLSMIRGDLRWHPERFASFLEQVVTPAGLLYFAPMILVAAACIALGFAGTAVIAVALTAMTLLAYWVGLTPAGTAGVSYSLVLLLAIAIVPTATTRAHRIVTAGAAATLWVVGWLSAFQWTAVNTWMTTIGAGS